MSSIKRPKRDETEEDLLREQEQFLSKNNAKKVKNVLKDENSERSSDTKNKIADNHDLPQIVCHIIEKNVNNFSSFPEPISKSSNYGFPKPIRRSDDLVPKRGKSLFAQQLDKNKGISDELMQTSDEEVTDESIVVGSGLGINNWKNEIKKIREQNQLLINQMDKNEVLKMREELMSKLDKNTVDFIRNKRFVNKSKERTEVSTDMQMNEEKQVVQSKDPVNQVMETKVSVNENDLPIKQSEVKEQKWLNMDVVEKDKLSWMGDLPEKQSSSSSQVTNSARFDFEGCLIDNNEEIDVHLGLHHHGEDQSSPGYTIQELYTFVESSFNAQKVIGLEVFTKIFNKAYHGLFDNCFNENVIIQLLKSSALVLMTRKCIDDSSETVWKVALNALHAMLCNTIVDELYLDRGFVLFNHGFDNLKNIPDLKPCYDSSIKLEELTDEQYLGLDVIECLVKRTALLERITFLLDFNKSQLDSKCVNSLLEILIRMSRHSPDSRQAIIKCPHLLEAIIKNFIPVSIVLRRDIVFNKPNPKALKLIRILTECNYETTLQIMSDFPQVMEALKVYLTLNPENCENASEILQLSIESLRVWLNIMSVKVGISHFLDMLPIVIKQLEFCQTHNPLSDSNGFDWQYSATLISLAKYFVQQNPNFSAFSHFISLTLLKWLSILKNELFIPNFDVNVTILSAIEYLLVAQMDRKPLYDLVFGIINSTTIMNKLMDRMIDNSNLVGLSVDSQGNQRDSSNLPSYGSIYYRNLDNIAILNERSPICLLLAFVRTMRSSPKDNINQKYFDQYVMKVTKNLKFNINLNLFDHYELNLLTQICLLCPTLPSIQTDHVYSFLNISLLMISFIKNDGLKQDLLNNVVFNKSIHSNQITESIAKLNLNPHFDSKITTILPQIDSFDSIKALYYKFSNFDSSHWVFDPLIKSLKNEKSVTVEVYNCLLFVDLIVTNHKNYLTQMISSMSAVFCLISSVFLIPGEVFFDESVQTLLYDILRKLLSFDGFKCQKEDRVPHFETVGDFFAQLLNQFESVSYGNKLFINYLLVFCQRKSSSLFRNRLFFDNPTALRVVNINFNEVVLPLDNFLFPIENDLDTLETYLKSLLCGALDPKHSPVLYLMAIHHLNHALFGSSRVLSDKEKQRFDKLIRSVHNSSNNELKTHLLNYSHFDENVAHGMGLK